MEKFLKLVGVSICLLIINCCFFLNVENTYAAIKVNGSTNQKELQRSLESLSDLDNQTWQLVVYPRSSSKKEKLTLRIVGCPGSLRVYHPINLIVSSGRKTWDLKEITEKSKIYKEVRNDSAAEFDLSPVVLALQKNKPLRLVLPGVINDLPIPPYLVGEWRELTEQNYD